MELAAYYTIIRGPWLAIHGRASPLDDLISAASPGRASIARAGIYGIILS
ncbi:MAG: hypothetical protein IJ829_01220 [Kiritimatiellae bacterium]|nr:hypothetical protein [Kiritimatiellia bacterium]